MRLTVMSMAVLASLGLASAAEARCVACPAGFTFWHSRDLCVSDAGDGATAAPLAEKPAPPPTTAQESRG